ncbi:hypothetical protein PRZ48_005761 [Zasmidium cellare]|uniref:BTB domain-containing protein n=1 Tax=Zasmidium cellare TaxID=395010 RepID=A0ABR0EL90_ZASCE|nr:hypothetical protein PRZ48_005761 [Zasmidium cellare]
MAGLEGAGASHARYFNNSAHSDVTIHFSDRQVKAHKIVLASQSEHFRAMFEGGFAEATSRDIHLHEDDPEAMYGALAWCYGLLYDGKTTFESWRLDSMEDPWKRTERDQWTYLINLYATGGKYLMPKMQAHAEEHFTLRMKFAKSPRYAAFVPRHGPVFRDTWMGRWPTPAKLLYHTLGDCAKELRPAFVKAFWVLAPAFKDTEMFNQLMVEIPELALDMLKLAIAEKEDPKKD